MGDQGIRTGKRLTPPSDDGWRHLAAMVARYLPGLGDPMDMTYVDLEAWTDPMAEIIRRENGSSRDEDSHRARVEADMRRLHG